MADDTRMDNDNEDELVDMIVPMRPYRHTDEAALVLPKEKLSLAQIVIQSAEGLDTDDNEKGKNSIYYVAENAYGMKFQDMPFAVQLNVAEYVGRMAELIGQHTIVIAGNATLPRRLLFYLIEIHDGDYFGVRSAYGRFYTIIRGFLEKTKEQKENIIEECMEHYKTHGNHVHTRPGEAFWSRFVYSHYREYPGLEDL